MVDTVKGSTLRENGGECVLVVEDHRPFRDAVTGFLRSEGYRVVSAADGVAALETFAEVCPDLIIADVMMPRMDGYDFYKAVRSRRDVVRVPFIFLSARADREDIIKGKGLGAEDYITKPFDPKELAATVRARLRRARDLRQADVAEFEQLKRQIITILSHELRTPLTYVKGYTDIAIEDVSSFSPESLHQFLLGIKRGSDRLTRLVEDLLLLVRLDSGEAAREFSVRAGVHCSIAELITRVVERYRVGAQTRGVSLVLDLDGTTPALRVCEPFLCDALGRLIDNALKFTRGAGKTVVVKARPDGGWFAICVIDEGIGIRADELPHLFERFRQIDRLQLEQQGVGLGVPIAAGLVGLHGGGIGVESQPGVGSVFTIRLPLVRPLAAP